ncbi:hypothetical protein EAF00_009077 [Botryotinia globosa]|nr:hypothetical protein EAF00_009077 [Botryotinia globosa]
MYACRFYIARKLREAGAIILGKTNPSQWGHFGLFNISNGWSVHGGQTYGPYFPRQDPSGSLSGSAVAATQVILQPSHFNNIVGVKPTVGLTSRHLVVPVSEHMDTIGPMTKTVKDAAYVLHSIADVDHLDNYTSAIPYGTDSNFVNACNISALKATRLGVPRNVISLIPISGADELVSAGPNIPFGFSFLGAKFTDAKLIGLAYAFEQRTMNRITVHPYIKPRTDLRDMVGMHVSQRRF